METMAEDDPGVLPMYDEEDEEEAAAEKEKRRQQSRKPRKELPWPEESLTPEEKARKEMNFAMATKLVECNPKTGGRTYTRVWFLDFSRFDIDEETQYGPMRFTDSLVGEDHVLTDSLNVLCVKIMSSDVGYPVNVYGTVIIRDRLDMKCIYVFQRNRDSCQLVQSEGESLILTGPSRGLLFITDVYVEINLKIKEDKESNDRQFSKGLLDVDRFRIYSNIVKKTLDSWLSVVDLLFAHVKNALEGTIEIKILSGPEAFNGKINACSTDVPNHILLYDSDVDGVITDGDGDGKILQLLRRVVAVSNSEMLIICIHSHSDDAHYICKFTPRIKGADEQVAIFGPYEMLLKVVWSTM
ncbi:hypothetical protein ACP70R_036262 [Stipagrostis hirtigluma subsp. patula]